MTASTKMADRQAASSTNKAAPESVGVWTGDAADTSFAPLDAIAIRASIRVATKVVFDPESHRVGLAQNGEISSAAAISEKSPGQQYPLLGILPPLYPEWLGDRGFQEIHGVRFAYVGGAMARGIGSARLIR